MVFEGWDASGKGGCISGSSRPLDPRHVRVAQFAAPTYDEKRHHFLWRFWPTLPGWGGMAVLDRSWYGRVLVERVEGFATEEQWRRAYQEICEFERTLVDEGMILVKFWLHLSDRGAAAPVRAARSSDPLKQWKLTDEDWRNRDKRARVRGRGRGHARPHRHAVRAVVAGRGRQQALGQGQGGRDRDRGRSRTGIARPRVRGAAAAGRAGAEVARLSRNRDQPAEP